ncbi:hypothetical protein HYY75_11360 [bacterium]|nr:hypothetical protein [bacterium]
MGFIRVIKCMKVEDNCPIDVTFRTSRFSVIFGALLILGSLIIIFKIALRTVDSPFSSFILAIGIPTAAILLFSGILLLTHRKSVIINKQFSRIEVLESGIFQRNRATFLFKDILHIEVCPIDECLFASRWCSWTVKVYSKRNDGFEAFRLFESLEFTAAEEAGQVLSQILGKPIVWNSCSKLIPSFSSPVVN